MNWKNDNIIFPNILIVWFKWNLELACSIKFLKQGFIIITSYKILIADSNKLKINSETG